MFIDYVLLVFIIIISIPGLCCLYACSKCFCGCGKNRTLVPIRTRTVSVAIHPVDDPHAHVYPDPVEEPRTITEDPSIQNSVV